MPLGESCCWGTPVRCQPSSGHLAAQSRLLMRRDASIFGRGGHPTLNAAGMPHGCVRAVSISNGMEGRLPPPMWAAATGRVGPRVPTESQPRLAQGKCREDGELGLGGGRLANTCASPRREGEGL